MGDPKRPITLHSPQTLGLKSDDGPNIPQQYLVMERYGACTIAPDAYTAKLLRGGIENCLHNPA